MKIFLILILSFVFLVFTVGCSGTDTALNSSVSTSADETANQPQIVVFEDETLTATYLGLSDVAGQIGLSFSLQNRSDKEIMVLPINSSINDVMVQFTSGIPATIQPGKTFNQVWMANPQTVGIAGSSDVTEVEFNLTYGDIETETITIKQ